MLVSELQRTRLVHDYMQREGIGCLEWSARPLGLNQIEHMCYEMRLQILVHQVQLRSIQELEVGVGARMGLHPRWNCQKSHREHEKALPSKQWSLITLLSLYL
jgi:hypothetical protein